MKKALCLLAACLLLGSSLASCTSVPENITVHTSENNVISLSASGQRKVAPDKATIAYGVNSEAEDAQTCQKNNADAIGQVVEKLKSMGIDEKNIQTSDYHLRPKMDYNNGEKIVGYQMNTTITVTGLDMDVVGSVVDQSVEAGINTIDYIQYEVSNYDELYQEALDDAIQSAKEKAQAIAQSTGNKLKEVVYVQDRGGDDSYRYDAGSEDLMMKAEDMAEKSVSVAPGEIEIKAQIDISFRIE